MPEERHRYCPRCSRAFAASAEVCGFDGARLTDRFLDFIPHNKTRLSGAILADRYKLCGELDRGATARIFLAEDLLRGLPVVVKMLDREHASDDRKRERFLREAETAKIIDHPNVPDAFFVGTRGDGTPFFVMEFLFGESLGTRLRRSTRVDVPAALGIARAVAIGLEAAHGANILHRDVKPDNVFLVGEPGEHHAVKILDFGYAKAGDTNITGGGMVIGTPEFMAPEQCLSDPADVRADVYALGAVMYRALTGRLLVDEGVSMELRLAQQVARTPASPRSIDGDVPEAVDAIVMRCLKKDPARRYASMSELVTALDHAIAGEARSLPIDDDDPPYVPKTELAREIGGLFAHRLRELARA